MALLKLKHRREEALPAVIISRPMREPSPLISQPRGLGLQDPSRYRIPPPSWRTHGPPLGELRAARRWLERKVVKAQMVLAVLAVASTVAYLWFPWVTAGSDPRCPLK